MASLVHHKDVENKLHEQLHGNILLLTNFHTTSDDFKSVFKPQMFQTNNKKGFLQVIYFLLEVINPDILKQKITSWPPFDRKLEDKFRNEVLRYINELRIENTDFNIPSITASHLISPGGIMFVKFIHKVSQFALYQVLTRNHDLEVLGPVKYSKNQAVSALASKNLQQKICNVEAATENEVKRFNDFHRQALSKSQLISNKMSIRNRELADIKKIYDAKCTHSGIVNYESTITELSNKLEKLSKSGKYFQNINGLIQECNVKLSYVLNKCLLEYKKGDLKVPDCIAHLIDAQCAELDLSQLFVAVNTLLREKSLDFADFPISQIYNMTKVVEELLNEYSIIENRICDATVELNKIRALNFKA